MTRCFACDGVLGFFLDSLGTQLCLRSSGRSQLWHGCASVTHVLLATSSFYEFADVQSTGICKDEVWLENLDFGASEWQGTDMRSEASFCSGGQSAWEDDENETGTHVAHGRP